MKELTIAHDIAAGESGDVVAVAARSRRAPWLRARPAHVIFECRGMLGAGLTLLFGEKLAPPQRRALEMVLTVTGMLSTAPFAYDVLRRPGE